MTSERHEFARALRKHQTPAEDLLWQRLRGSRFNDGKQHGWFEDYDAGRTEVLERLGVCVVRFANEEVCNELDSVLARIHAALRLPFD